MEHGCPDLNTHYHSLHRQYQFVQCLADVVIDIRKDKNVQRPKKLEILKEKLVVPRKEIGSSFAEFEPIPLPLEPGTMVDGILPGRTEIFKSAMLPCKFVFRQADVNDCYKVIFKVGNDLRQDQFAIQMIQLFNRIFLDNGLDLNITPYKVLATSPTCGKIGLPLLNIFRDTVTAKYFLHELKQPVRNNGRKISAE